jgi:plasmid stabilization system protein ParE
MRLIWTHSASADLHRIHRFLSAYSVRVATERIRRIRAGALRVEEMPRMGVRIENIIEPETRRIFVADCEVRYELVGEQVIILRVFHTRENR